MVGYAGPVDWRDVNRRALLGGLQGIQTVDEMDNFQARPDPMYDYLQKAEEYAFQANNSRQRLLQQLGRNSQIDLQNSINQRTANAMGGGPGGGRFRSFWRAIKNQESGGNYGAVNPDSGAAGAYQILPSNFTATGSGWDMEALGRDVSLQQFMNHPKIQNKIARHKMRSYFDKYGAAGAASAWYSGDPSLWNNQNPQGGYPSIHDYVLQILAQMKR